LKQNAHIRAKRIKDQKKTKPEGKIEDGYWEGVDDNEAIEFSYDADWAKKLNKSPTENPIILLGFYSSCTNKPYRF
jgi:hypothetical protein